MNTRRQNPGSSGRASYPRGDGRICLVCNKWKPEQSYTFAGVDTICDSCSHKSRRSEDNIRSRTRQSTHDSVSTRRRTVGNISVASNVDNTLSRRDRSTRAQSRNQPTTQAEKCEKEVQQVWRSGRTAMGNEYRALHAMYWMRSSNISNGIPINRETSNS